MVALFINYIIKKCRKRREAVKEDNLSKSDRTMASSLTSRTP